MQMDKVIAITEEKQPIFCFIFDGSEKYSQMTLDAINSLQEKSLDAHIGIIIPPGIENFDTIKNRILQSIIQRENIHFVEGQKHFDNWNPTQHKLDMQLFAGQFNPVIWLDSDIFVLKDLLQSAKIFAQSGKWMALLRDHVNNDPAFLSRWEDGAERCFVPQACYMIFRSDIIKEFFNLWESIWREWIYPSPFFSHPDPAPHFPGSAFCIEQYALAQALRRFIGYEIVDSQRFTQCITVMNRMQIFIDTNVINGENQLIESTSNKQIKNKQQKDNENINDQENTIQIRKPDKMINDHQYHQSLNRRRQNHINYDCSQIQPQVTHKQQPQTVDQPDQIHHNKIQSFSPQQQYLQLINNQNSNKNKNKNDNKRKKKYKEKKQKLIQDTYEYQKYDLNSNQLNSQQTNSQLLLQQQDQQHPSQKLPQEYLHNNKYSSSIQEQLSSQFPYLSSKQSSAYSKFNLPSFPLIQNTTILGVINNEQQEVLDQLQEQIFKDNNIDLVQENQDIDVENIDQESDFEEPDSEQIISKSQSITHLRKTYDNLNDLPQNQRQFNNNLQQYLNYQAKLLSKSAETESPLQKRLQRKKVKQMQQSYEQTSQSNCDRIDLVNNNKINELLTTDSNILQTLGQQYDQDLFSYVSNNITKDKTDQISKPSVSISDSQQYKINEIKLLNQQQEQIISSRFNSFIDLSTIPKSSYLNSSYSSDNSIISSYASSLNYYIQQTNSNLNQSDNQEQDSPYKQIGVADISVIQTINKYEINKENIQQNNKNDSQEKLSQIQQSNSRTQTYTKNNSQQDGNSIVPFQQQQQLQQITLPNGIVCVGAVEVKVKLQPKKNKQIYKQNQNKKRKLIKKMKKQQLQQQMIFEKENQLNQVNQNAYLIDNKEADDIDAMNKIEISENNQRVNKYLVDKNIKQINSFDIKRYLPQTYVSQSYSHQNNNLSLKQNDNGNNNKFDEISSDRKQKLQQIRNGINMNIQKYISRRWQSEGRQIDKLRPKENNNHQYSNKQNHNRGRQIDEIDNQQQEQKNDSKNYDNNFTVGKENLAMYSMYRTQYNKLNSKYKQIHSGTQYKQQQHNSIQLSAQQSPNKDDNKISNQTQSNNNPENSRPVFVSKLLLPYIHRPLPHPPSQLNRVTLTQNIQQMPKQNTQQHTRYLSQQIPSSIISSLYQQSQQQSNSVRQEKVSQSKDTNLQLNALKLGQNIPHNSVLPPHHTQQISIQPVKKLQTQLSNNKPGLQTNPSILFLTLHQNDQHLDQQQQISHKLSQSYPIQQIQLSSQLNYQQQSQSQTLSQKALQIPIQFTSQSPQTYSLTPYQSFEASPQQFFRQTSQSPLQTVSPAQSHQSNKSKLNLQSSYINHIYSHNLSLSPESTTANPQIPSGFAIGDNFDDYLLTSYNVGQPEIPLSQITKNKKSNGNLINQVSQRNIAKNYDADNFGQPKVKTKYKGQLGLGLYSSFDQIYNINSKRKNQHQYSQQISEKIFGNTPSIENNKEIQNQNGWRTIQYKKGRNKYKQQRKINKEQQCNVKEENEDYLKNQNDQSSSQSSSCSSYTHSSSNSQIHSQSESSSYSSSNSQSHSLSLSETFSSSELYYQDNSSEQQEHGHHMGYTQISQYSQIDNDIDQSIHSQQQSQNSSYSYQQRRRIHLIQLRRKMINDQINGAHSFQSSIINRMKDFQYDYDEDFKEQSSNVSYSSYSVTSTSSETDESQKQISRLKDFEQIPNIQQGQQKQKDVAFEQTENKPKFQSKINKINTQINSQHISPLSYIRKIHHHHHINHQHRNIQNIVPSIIPFKSPVSSQSSSVNAQKAAVSAPANTAINTNNPNLPALQSKQHIQNDFNKVNRQINEINLDVKKQKENLHKNQADQSSSYDINNIHYGKINNNYNNKLNHNAYTKCKSLPPSPLINEQTKNIIDILSHKKSRYLQILDQAQSTTQDQLEILRNKDNNNNLQGYNYQPQLKRPLSSSSRTLHYKKGEYFHKYKKQHNLFFQNVINSQTRSLHTTPKKKNKILSENKNFEQNSLNNMNSIQYIEMKINSENDQQNQEQTQVHQNQEQTLTHQIQLDPPTTQQLSQSPTPSSSSHKKSNSVLSDQNQKSKILTYIQKDKMRQRHYSLERYQEKHRKVKKSRHMKVHAIQHEQEELVNNNDNNQQKDENIQNFDVVEQNNAKQNDQEEKQQENGEIDLISTPFSQPPPSTQISDKSNIQQNELHKIENKYQNRYSNQNQALYNYYYSHYSPHHQHHHKQTHIRENKLIDSDNPSKIAIVNRKTLYNKQIGLDNSIDTYERKEIYIENANKENDENVQLDERQNKSDMQLLNSNIQNEQTGSQASSETIQGDSQSQQQSNQLHNQSFHISSSPIGSPFLLKKFINENNLNQETNNTTMERNITIVQNNINDVNQTVNSSKTDNEPLKDNAYSKMIDSKNFQQNQKQTQINVSNQNGVSIVPVQISFTPLFFTHISQQAPVLIPKQSNTQNNNESSSIKSTSSKQQSRSYSQSETILHQKQIELLNKDYKNGNNDIIRSEQMEQNSIKQTQYQQQQAFPQELTSQSQKLSNLTHSPLKLTSKSFFYSWPLSQNQNFQCDDWKSENISFKMTSSNGNQLKRQFPLIFPLIPRPTQTVIAKPNIIKADNQQTIHYLKVNSGKVKSPYDNWIQDGKDNILNSFAPFEFEPQINSHNVISDTKNKNVFIEPQQRQEIVNINAENVNSTLQSKEQDNKQQSNITEQETSGQSYNSVESDTDSRWGSKSERREKENERIIKREEYKKLNGKISGINPYYSALISKYRNNNELGFAQTLVNKRLQYLRQKQMYINRKQQQQFQKQQIDHQSLMKTYVNQKHDITQHQDEPSQQQQQKERLLSVFEPEDHKFDNIFESVVDHQNDQDNAGTSVDSRWNSYKRSGDKKQNEKSHLDQINNKLIDFQIKRKNILKNQKALEKNIENQRKIQNNNNMQGYQTPFQIPETDILNENTQNSFTLSNFDQLYSNHFAQHFSSPTQLQARYLQQQKFNKHLQQQQQTKNQPIKQSMLFFQNKNRTLPGDMASSKPQIFVSLEEQQENAFEIIEEENETSIPEEDEVKMSDPTNKWEQVQETKQIDIRDENQKHEMDEISKLGENSPTLSIKPPQIPIVIKNPKDNINQMYKTYKTFEQKQFDQHNTISLINSIFPTSSFADIDDSSISIHNSPQLKLHQQHPSIISTSNEQSSNFNSYPHSHHISPPPSCSFSFKKLSLNSNQNTSVLSPVISSEIKMSLQIPLVSPLLLDNIDPVQYVIGNEEQFNNNNFYLNDKDIINQIQQNQEQNDLNKQLNKHMHHHNHSRIHKHKHHRNKHHYHRNKSRSHSQHSLNFNHKESKSENKRKAKEDERFISNQRGRRQINSQSRERSHLSSSLSVDQNECESIEVDDIQQQQQQEEEDRNHINDNQQQQIENNENDEFDIYFNSQLQPVHVDYEHGAIFLGGLKDTLNSNNKKHQGQENSTENIQGNSTGIQNNEGGINNSRREWRMLDLVGFTDNQQLEQQSLDNNLNQNKAKDENQKYETKKNIYQSKQFNNQQFNNYGGAEIIHTYNANSGQTRRFVIDNKETIALIEKELVQHQKKK